MVRFVRHKRSKVSTDEAVPRWVVLPVELLLDVRGDIFLSVVLLHALLRADDGKVFHILGHFYDLNCRLRILGHFLLRGGCLTTLVLLFSLFFLC